MQRLPHLLLAAISIFLVAADADPELTEPADQEPSGRANEYRPVNTALIWLARRQADDGSWDYSLPVGSPPRAASRIEATAWVLAAMASTGITHTYRGPFSTSMNNGVEFLLAQQRDSPHGNDFSGKGNSIVAHALATYTMAEIYGLSGQAALREAVGRAADLISATQDAKTGGWVTTTGQAADLATSYRQIAALRATESALEDSKYREAVRKADKFLTSLGPHDIARHHNVPPEKDYTYMAMYLICRMGVTGTRNNPNWRPSIQAILDRGPAKNDAVYNYYTTQAVFDWDGEGAMLAWSAWNRALTKELRATQIRQGNEAGSWPPGQGTSLDDDRLYRTVLNLLTLQVYERHMARAFHFR
jgi:hypothetical protein